MQTKNKVFFTLSLIFLVFVLLCTVFALIFGAELGGIQANGGSTAGGGAESGNAIGLAAAAVLLAFLMVVSSVAAWFFTALTVLFSALNLGIGILRMRITSAAFLGASLLCSVVVLVSFLSRVG